LRTNSRGAHKERWVHSHGCRRWFNVERDTVTYRILRVYQMGGAEAETQPVEAEMETPRVKVGRGG
jgi:sarcosine oxidase subunit delta